MFKALLKIDGIEGPEPDGFFLLLKCNYVIDRDTDQSGRPAGDLRYGKITCQIQSSELKDIWDWAGNPYAMKKGEIQFWKRDDPSPSKVLKFEDAYMVEYGEDFDVVGSNKEQPMVETFTMSARKVELGMPLEKVWPK